MLKITNWYYKVNQFYQRHLLLQSIGDQYSWSLFKLFWNIKILGIYDLKSIKDNTLVFCIMLIKKISKDTIKIENLYLDSNHVKKNIPYYMNIKFEEYACEGVKEVIITIKKDNIKAINFFIDILEFEEDNNKTLKNLYSSKENKSIILRKILR